MYARELLNVDGLMFNSTSLAMRGTGTGAGRSITSNEVRGLSDPGLVQ